MNQFIQPLEKYTRDFDIIGSYKTSISKAISLATGDDYNDIYAYVEEKMKADWEPKSPKLRVLKREYRQDRHKAEVDLLSYLRWNERNAHILAPNMITYINPMVEESFLSGFIGSNLKNRSKIKKEMFIAKQDGNEDHATFCNLLQANAKIRNNSISGALSSPYNPLYYASSHPSLTSVCRTITSYANACNEKFMASNRHYYTPEITIENIVYVSTRSDLNLIAEVCDQFGIVPPSVEYTCELVLRSSRLYWEDEVYERLIREMIGRLTPYERAAFCYVGDMNALMETNDGPIRDLYDKLIRPPRLIREKEDQVRVAKSASDDDVSLASLLCIDFIKGRKVTDLNPEEYQLWTSYIQQVIDVFTEYKPFIDAFISTVIMPGSIHSLPTIIRRSVVGSDTDSSIFSTQKQVKWYTGTASLTTRGTKAGAITAYMVSQLISHTLAMMSAQIGVARDQLFRLAMKSEIYSQAMINTGVTKTYAFDETAQEGNVFSKPKYVIKGVLLKSSKLPTRLRIEIEKFIEYILSVPGVEGGISPLEPASILAKIEHMLMRHLLAGHAEFFKTEQVKTPQTYSRGEEDSKIVLKEFWNHVFGDKYGHVEMLPADTLKVNTLTEKKLDLEAWLETLDAATQQRAKTFLAGAGKKGLTQMLAPYDLLPEGKVPKELIAAIDLRKMLFSLMQPFYILMNGVSLNVAPDSFTRFWSDTITEAQAERHLPESYHIDLE